MIYNSIKAHANQSQTKNPNKLNQNKRRKLALPMPKILSLKQMVGEIVKRNKIQISTEGKLINYKNSNF